MSKLGDQPAFPALAGCAFRGMTYRQWLVGMALQGTLSRGNPGFGSAAAAAVEAADAAIAAQEKRTDATGRKDDPLPATAEWVGTFAIQRRAYPDQFILDEISSDYYLRFDCSPLEGQEEPDCSVLLHVLPPTDEQAAVLIYHATRGDVRRLLDALKVIPKKLARP